MPNIFNLENNFKNIDKDLITPPNDQQTSFLQLLFLTSGASFSPLFLFTFIS